MNNLRKLIIVSVLGFGISLILFFLLVQPNLDKVSALYSEAAAKRTEHQTLLGQILAYKSSQSEIASVSNKDFILNSVLERNKLQVAIEELEAGAFLAGVGESMSIREELDEAGKSKPAPAVIQGNSDIDEVYYTVTVSGPFISMVKFIQYAEHLPHFTEILKISLRSSDDSPQIVGELEGIFMVRKVK